MIKKGWGIECEILFMVICFFFIIFKRVDWVWGVVWLILFVNSMFVNIGLSRNLNFLLWGF